MVEQVEEDVEMNDENAKKDTVLHKQLREQIEFYFSNNNLMRDKFMKKKLNHGQKHCFQLIDFLSFNKIKTIIKNNDLPVLEQKRVRPEIIILEEEAANYSNKQSPKEPKPNSLFLKGNGLGQHTPQEINDAIKRVVQPNEIDIYRNN